MKFSQSATGIMIISTIILLMGLNPGCKDPEDYKPPDEPLIPPPPPPQLLHPPNGNSYVWFEGFTLEFDWNAIAYAELYETQIDTLDSFTSSNIYTSTDNNLVLSFDDFDDYYWRVRAGSSSWQGWYTDWSETWSFIIMSPVK